MFVALWAAWAAVFVLTGWAEGWGGALGAGCVMAMLCALPAGAVWGVVSAVVWELRDAIRAHRRAP